MKTKKQIEAKIKKVKKKLFDSPVQEETQLFTYWLGYLRALEWTQQKEK